VCSRWSTVYGLNTGYDTETPPSIVTLLAYPCGVEAFRQLVEWAEVHLERVRTRAVNGSIVLDTIGNVRWAVSATQDMAASALGAAGVDRIWCDGMEPSLQWVERRSLGNRRHEGH
jgi:hypothetical protein